MVIVIVTDFLAFVFDDTHKNERQEYQIFVIRFGCEIWICVYSFLYVKKEKNDLKIYRPGKMPVLRGSFLKWNNKVGYLWGSGFKPRIETYDGWEVPIPLKIIVQYGDTPVEQVASDIFSLTKLNYNACKLGDSEPVTIMFSDEVGEILISNPKVKERKPQFKFYI
jgi:hypothetical protein